MIKKLVSILLLIILSMPILEAYELTKNDKKQLNFNINRCENIKQSDIPTIFIPGILASWYSEEGYKETKIKRWIPDPITHAYDTLFYTFKQNGYSLKDVFYKDEFNTYIKGNPKQSLYLFGYDWKKDNKITAKLLRDLVLNIRLKYEEENGCDIGTVNIVAHSMGGLVARAMLEDMCASDEGITNYYNNNIKKGQIKNIKSSICNNTTRINKFITISTPHRGSPNSFPMWVKGDTTQTNGYIEGEMLKLQFGINNDEDLYEIIHGYNEIILNGIITIGQLLPDLKNNNNFNKKLLYLNENNKKTDNKNHPENSFLEELNKKENIDKMFKNIKGKYLLYYSSLTGNKKELFSIKNNIVGFNTTDSIFKENKTNTYIGKDIYSLFPKYAERNLYNSISKNINEEGLGGDGTVPTKNLLLTNNEDGIESNNSKYESVEIKCINEELLKKEGYNLEKIENKLTKKLGNDTILELCSHTKMPILTSIQVFENISGNDIFYGLDSIDKIKKEQELLYKYLGYADYSKNYKRFTETWYGGVYNNILGGIQNSDELNSRFGIGFYNNLFKNRNEINDFIKNKDNEGMKRISLGFSGKVGTIDSLTRYEVLSPINIIIEDEQGRKIGIDPETGLIINEIPGAWTSGNTEGSGEPEFFLIPKTGTGLVNHKITSYPTGDGEYHIVAQNLENDNRGILQEKSKVIIAGEAKIGIDEKYEINISNKGGSYIKIENNIEEKYKDLLKRIYLILDNKFDKRKKEKLKNNLEKVIFRGNRDSQYTYKVFYLVGKIFNYLKKNDE